MTRLQIPDLGVTNRLHVDENVVRFGIRHPIDEPIALYEIEPFYLYSLELKQAWKLALMARSFRYGEHGAWEEVRAIRAKEFEIRTRRPLPVNCDGEIVTRTPARFTIRPSAVTVFAP